jgi:hypothetical protein
MLLERNASRQRIAKISRRENMDICARRPYLNPRRGAQSRFQKEDFGNGP